MTQQDLNQDLDPGQVTFLYGAIDRAFGRMPYGGLADFRTIRQDFGVARGPADILDVLRDVEVNLSHLADVLAGVVAQGDARDAELRRYQRAVDGLAVLRDLLGERS